MKQRQKIKSESFFSSSTFKKFIKDALYPSDITNWSPQQRLERRRFVQKRLKIAIMSLMIAIGSGYALYQRLVSNVY